MGAGELQAHPAPPISCGSYTGPGSEAVQMNEPRSIHAGTGWVDLHGDGRADVAEGAGHGVCLMKPDAHWDIIGTSCQNIRASEPGQQQGGADKQRTEETPPS